MVREGTPAGGGEEPPRREMVEVARHGDVVDRVGVTCHGQTVFGEHPELEGLEGGVKSLPPDAAADAVPAGEFLVEVAAPHHEVVFHRFENSSLMS